MAFDASFRKLVKNYIELKIINIKRTASMTLCGINEYCNIFNPKFYCTFLCVMKFRIYISL